MASVKKMTEDTISMKDVRGNWYKEYTGKGFLSFSTEGEVERVDRQGLSDDFSRKDFNEWILDPEQNNERIRDLSRYLYVSASSYNRVVNHYTNLLNLDYVLVPRLKVHGTEIDEEKLLKSREKVLDFCDGIMAKPVLRDIIKATIKDGCYFGYERKNGSNYFLQRLPNNYCRDGAIIDGMFGVEFDFSYFDTNEEKLKLYDAEFTQKYNAYKNNTEEEWQLLDINKSICIPMESQDFNFPAFISMFGDLLDLDEYYNYMKRSIEMDVAKILIQKAPMNEETGEMLVDPDELMFFHNALAKSLDKEYRVVSTPFDVDAITFTRGKGNDAGMTGVDTMREKVGESSGVSPVLFGTTDTATGLKMNHDANVSFVFALLEKIEMWANFRLKKIATNKYGFRIQFLPTTQHNKEDYFDLYNSLFTTGGSLDMVIASSGINPYDYYSILEVENLLGVKDLLQVPESAYNTTGENEDDEGGRPESDDISDEGEQTRDDDGNDGKGGN